MQEKLQLFQNDEFGKLQVLLIGDKPYFPATECAKLLGYSEPHKAVTRHTHGGIKYPVTDSLGRLQETKFIPEGDLYRLIIRSKLPSAVKFEAWICDEILPSVRKFGFYATESTLEQMISSPDFAIKLFSALKAEKEKTTALQSQVTEYLPKAVYYDIILQSKNVVPVSILAKDYGYSAVNFNKLLCGFKVQYRVGDCWVLYQQYADKGYTKTRTYSVGENTSSVRMYWTQSGRRFLYELLKFYGILPLAERAVSGGDDDV